MEDWKKTEKSVLSSNRKIIFFGHHKCGSRFFRMILLAQFAALNGYEQYGYKIRNKPYYFNELHNLDLDNIDWAPLLDERKIILNTTNAGAPLVDKINQQTTEYRGIHVIRDPRQILVSSYFHHLEGHPLSNGEWFWEKLAHDRSVLEKLDQEQGVLYELDNITKDILENQIFAWRKNEQILEIKLEEFDPDIAGNLRRIGDFLGLKNIPETVSNAQTKFVNPASRHWRDIFTRRIKAVFKERYGAGLIKLGYEEGLDW